MILAAGLTPAWQRILEFDHWQHGGVNRAARVAECASGKVLNVARALACFPGDSLAVCPVGGTTGRAISEEFAQHGLAARWCQVAAATRTCTTLVDRATNQTTELVENAAPLSPDEILDFRQALIREAGAAKLLVLTGSLPPGAPTELVGELLRACAVPAVLDMRGPELLAALPARPLLVKPNRDELARSVGRPLDTEASLLEAMRAIAKAGAEWVLVTQGASASWLMGGAEVWRFETSPVDVVNPIGCGDCLAAALAWSVARGDAPPLATRWGLAAAAENARTLLPARLTYDAVAARVETIVGARVDV